jgi:hypothetical protein
MIPVEELVLKDYILVLSSEGLAKLEADSEQTRVRGQEMRAHSINPRQRF